MIVFSTILLQLIIFFLPTQLGLHFWPDFSRTAGIKVDYLSPTLFFTDLLLFVYLTSSIHLLLRWFKKHFRSLIIFTVFIVLNTLFSISPLNSLFWWLRWILYLTFFLTLRLRKISWNQIKVPLLMSTFLVIFLEIRQIINQTSIGGIFYWLGERTFSASTPGLGRLSIFGLDIVRPQSTFSHPNSLAGYLLIVYYLLHLNKSPYWQRILIFVGLLLTLSKAVLFSFLLVIIFQISSLTLINVFLIISLIQLFLPNAVGTYQFIADRLFLLSPTKKILLHSPLLGVGLGGFIPSLVNLLPGSFLIPAKLQPVHNLLLLILSELGLLGAGLAALVIKINLKKVLQPRFLGFLALIIISGAFDHYWWTLPQNKLILLLAATILL